MLARLLGVKLLTLEGTVVLSPAQVQAYESARAPATSVAARATAPRAANQPAHAKQPLVGRGLAEAGQLIADSAATLKSVRPPAQVKAGSPQSQR